MTEPSYKDWYVGQKVVALHDHVHGYCGTSVVKGTVYTIREIFGYKGAAAVRLAEIRLPIHNLEGSECAWKTEHFRPLVTRKSDISVFIALLNPAKRKVRA